jgi:hypothetical protein
MLKIVTLGAAVALAALSVFGVTAAHAQNASSCPGGKDATASDCLQINQNDSQVSLIEINQQDELDNPDKRWSISGQVETNLDRVGQWIGLIEPGTDVVSDVVGIPTAGVLAFVSDATDFSSFAIFKTVTETSSPLDVTGDLLSAADRAAGFTAFFQSDLNAVPEPSTWAMMLLGFAGLGFVAYWKARPTRALAA